MRIREIGCTGRPQNPSLHFPQSPGSQRGFDFILKEEGQTVSDAKKVVEISEQGQRTSNAAAQPGPGEGASTLQRAFSALRTAAPFAQRLLPLLEGNIVTAVSNILGPHPQNAAPPVNLAPVESGLADLGTQQRDFGAQLMEQNTTLQRVEDQLRKLREATDRNTLEQQELKEGLRKLGAKVKVFALAGIVLLAISVVLNVLIYLHFGRVLP
jgi:hypothetical protein